MILVHRVFRREFHGIPDLIAGVCVGDTARATLVANHVTFMIDGLHHHHAAEDELAWPILLARAPAQQAEIDRMEAQHGGIAAAIVRVQSDLSEWTKAAVKRGASFLSKYPRMGIVLGGLVLDYSSP